MANREEWRVRCNEHNCKELEEKMPEECNVISFGHNDERVQVTNSATRGIIPEELVIGTIKVETGDALKIDKESEKTI